MYTIAIVSLAIVAGLVSISQYYSFISECDDKKTRFKYMILAFSLSASALNFILMILLHNERICFILYAFDKFYKVLIMGEIVMLTADIVTIKSEYISPFVSFLAYGTVLLFIIDAFIQGGRLTRSPFGIYFKPNAAWHKALYFIYYMAYTVMLIVFAAYKSSVSRKKCEKAETSKLTALYIVSASGFIAEIFMINFGMFYFPLTIITDCVSVILLRKLLLYHKRVVYSPDMFSKELDPARTDIAFVMDDRMRIICENKRAMIFSRMMKDEFIGRNITDVFKFPGDSLSQLSADPDGTPFGIGAEYPVNGRHADLVICHRLDPCGEIIATGVFVYNIDESEKVISHTEEALQADEGEIIESAKTVTDGASALIVDEDPLFLNALARLLEKYNIKVTRTMNGQDALSLAASNVYDIIFITFELTNNSGKYTVKKIRAMDGEYYGNVPIVFMTDGDINEKFIDFLDAGFSDYLKKPIDSKELGLVLTRWLWKRFDSSSPDKAQQADCISPQLTEMNSCMENAEYMLENGRSDKFLYCIRGVRRAAGLLELEDIEKLAADVEDSVVYGGREQTGSLFARLTKGVMDASTINA